MQRVVRHTGYKAKLRAQRISEDRMQRVVLDTCREAKLRTQRTSEDPADFGGTEGKLHGRLGPFVILYCILPRQSVLVRPQGASLISTLPPTYSARFQFPLI